METEKDSYLSTEEGKRRELEDNYSGRRKKTKKVGSMTGRSEPQR